MPLKNSNTVALERRVDLASFFCMIGRHGPAVALAVIAMVSVVAGFIIYRTVRGKRRKATAGATSTDSDSRDAGAETLIPADQEPEQRPEDLRISADSTVVKDEGSLDVKEDTGLKIRHRRLAVEKKPPPDHQSKSDWAQDNKHNASVEQVSELYTEEEEKGAEIDVETDGTVKVLQEKCHDDLSAEMDVSNEEEENIQGISKSTEATLEEPIVYIQDVPVASICYFKDVKSEEKNLQGSTDFSNDYSNNHCFPEEEKKSGGKEAKEELLGDQLTSEQAEIRSTVFVQVTKLQSQCHDTMLSFQQDADEDYVRDSTDINFNSHLLQLAEQNDESELACNQDSDVKEEVPAEDIASHDEESNPSSVVLDHTLPCLTHIIEPENINGDDSPSCITKGEMPAAQDIASHGEESNSSSVVLDTTLPRLNWMVDPENGDSSSVVNAKAQISGSGEISSMSSDQQQPQRNINEDDIFQALEVTSEAAPVTSEDGKPPVLQIHLPSFEQSEPTWSSSGLGGESGISSMTVSPDLPDVISECDMPTENVALTVKDDAQFEEQTEAQNSLLDDEALSAMNEDLANVVSGSYPSYFSQQPLIEQFDWANDSSFAANEDILGHEIEDRYYREMDRAVEQMAANVTRLTEELTVKTDMKADIKVVEINQKMDRAEKEKEEEEEDYEKTEISIMEATMDNNEWITDGNYLVLPWMNQSVPPFAQTHTQPDPVSTEDDHPGASVTDATCIDADASLSLNDVRQTIPLSPVHENGKKVVAVQPMPQNVNVTFRIHYLTHSPYQKVAITGNQQELGNWKKFIPLERAKDGNWATVVCLPAESIVEWKFVVVDKGEVCRWEECGNRLLDTGYGDDLLVDKWWGLL